MVPFAPRPGGDWPIPAQLNVWLGTIVVLMLVWSMKAGVRPGLNLHLLGATVFTLMFGRQLAIIGLSIVLAAVTLQQRWQRHQAGSRMP